MARCDRDCEACQYGDTCPISCTEEAIEKRVKLQTRYDHYYINITRDTNAGTYAEVTNDEITEAKRILTRAVKHYNKFM